MTKTICFFNGDMSRGGGTERVTQNITNELNKLCKYNIIVLSLKNDTNKSYYHLDAGVSHYVLNKTENNNTIMKTILLLKKFVKEKKVDILVNVDIMLGIFSLPLKISTKLKIIGWEQFNYYDNIGTPKSKYVRQLSLLFCDYYVNLTKSDMETFKKNLKVKCPITYIYNPVQYNEGNNNYNKNSKIIITAGNFYYTKGFDLAIEVAKSVFKKHNDWKWEFYGDGIELQNIKSLIQESNLTNNIILRGRKKDLTFHFREGSIYTSTSRTEGLGLVLLEAQSQNLPTVAFDVPFGPREIIENNINGYLIRPFDKEKMANKICQLIENKELRYRFAENASINLYNFNTKNIVEKWCKIFDEL